MKKGLMFLGAIILIIGIILGWFGIKNYLAEENAGKSYDDLKVQMEVEPLIDMPHVDEGWTNNPIDFDTLTAQYPDIYAWIRIPGTNVDYPIVQHESDNSYYLNHTIDGKKRIEGSI